MEAALLGEGDGSLRLQALVRVGVTSPATGSELHASGTSYHTSTSQQTQEDVEEELHHPVASSEEFPPGDSSGRRSGAGSL